MQSEGLSITFVVVLEGPCICCDKLSKLECTALQTQTTPGLPNATAIFPLAGELFFTCCVSIVTYVLIRRQYQNLPSLYSSGSH